jgi:PAS domain S-box-containing protein
MMALPERPVGVGTRGKRCRGAGVPDQPAQRTTSTRPFDTSLYDDALYRALVARAKKYAGFATDLEGRVVAWNPGAERLLGYDEAEILGRPNSVIFAPEDLRDRIPEREMEAAIHDGLAQDRRWHVRKDGTRFWADETLEEVRDANGAPTGFARILCDETDRGSAEAESAAAVEALREVNSRLLAAGIREQEARDEADLECLRWGSKRSARVP